MIAHALSAPLPVAPGQNTTAQANASADGSSEFARHLDHAATDKTGGPRATTKAPFTKERQKVDKGRDPADPTTKQAGGPVDSPVECPAETVAHATGQADEPATPTADAAALLAALPPLPQRPYPAGQTGPVRSGANGPHAGGTRAPASETDPVLTPPDLGGDTRDTRNAARAAVSFADALRETRAPGAEAAGRPAALETAALPLPAQAPVATGVSASAPAEARIAATPGSADFASQLGAQLTTFVKDGIQHAKLELHPMELGPVTVQIQLDGQAAQVNLSAEQAPTRAALEQALPDLAGSLREAGLTLTGGGVFEQPRQPDAQAGGRGDGSTRADARSERDTAQRESVTTQPVAAPRRRGVVDLVA